MATDQRPLPLSRNELFSIFKNMRVVRSFEKLFDLIPSNLIDSQDQIDEINIYLNKGIKYKSASYTTTQDDDTIVIDGSLSPIVISFGVGFEDGKTQRIKCADDTFPCSLNGNGATIDGETSLEIFALEVVAVQFKKAENVWWII